MRTFTYTRWSGARMRVEAQTVEFGPAHVVFRDFDGCIVLAERIEQVNGLQEENA